MKPTVYIFRGAPASGKGTVVPKFCELLPKPVALISQDVLRWGFHRIGRPVGEFNKLYNNVYSIVGEGETVIDSTGQTPDETVTLLKALI